MCERTIGINGATVTTRGSLEDTSKIQTVEKICRLKSQGKEM